MELRNDTLKILFICWVEISRNEPKMSSNKIYNTNFSHMAENKGPVATEGILFITTEKVALGIWKHGY